MLIRRCDFANTCELLAAHALQRAAYEVEAALIGTREIPGLRESVEELAASREEFWGLFDHNALAGLIATEGGATNISNPPPPLRISRLAVHPDYFRRGVGRSLVRYVLNTCTLDSPRTVRVSTGAANTPGRTLYESEGFTLLAEREVGGTPAADGTRIGGVWIVEYQRPASQP